MIDLEHGARWALFGAALSTAIILWPFAGIAADAAPLRTITVSGEGEAKAVPDEAHLSAGVLTQAKKAADALAANTQAMNAVFATLKRFGIPEKAIRTSGFSVEPQYESDQTGRRRPLIIGYEVSNSVQVTLDDMSKVGPALDALVSSGANSIGGIAFTVRDPKPLLARARIEAIQDATARADTYARAGGFALGAIQSVVESGAQGAEVVRVTAARFAAAAAPPPVAAGEESVTANVSVTFEIR